MWDFFEQPWTGLAIGAIILLIVAAAKNVPPQKYRLLVWLLPFAVAVAAFSLDYFFVTDKEQIKNVIKNAVKAVENENLKDIEPLLAEDYSDSVHKNKAEMMDECKFYLNRPFIDKIISSINQLNINNATPKASSPTLHR